MDTNEYAQHFSVLKKECLFYLCENNHQEDKKLYLDLTFGRGGHSFALADERPNAEIWATDQDPDAIQHGKDLIEQQNKKQIKLFKMNFASFPEYLRSNPELLQQFNQYGGFSGILMDLGVSSHQFDKPERGFSFRFDSPLDMRMAYDDNEAITAADIVNSFDEEDLANIFFEYGEEKFSRKIARDIIESRQKNPIRSTKDLENIIFHCYPKALRHGKVHPATRCFQALRIAVNRELDVLKEVLPDLFTLLSPQGRLVVISFHSLEDRIVKNVFRDLAKRERKSDQKTCSIITKKPIVPSDEEIKINSRSRSAKLRVIESL